MDATQQILCLPYSALLHIQSPSTILRVPLPPLLVPTSPSELDISALVLIPLLFHPMKQTKTHRCIFSAPNQKNWCTENTIFGGSVVPLMRSLCLNNSDCRNKVDLLIWRREAAIARKKNQRITNVEQTMRLMADCCFRSKKKMRAHYVNALWKHRILTLFRYFSSLFSILCDDS